MNVLIIDSIGYSLDFALRCEAEGHSVRVFMGPNYDGSRCSVGDGLITKVAEYEPSMRWADLILSTFNNKYIQSLSAYRSRGFPYFGPSVESTSWELSRGDGVRVFEAAGIPTIPSVEFSNYDRAIEFVLANSDKRFVSKPCGDAGKDLSYVSKGSRDLLFMLDRWKRNLKKKFPFILQEFVPGIEFAVGGYFGTNGFSEYFLENFEFKKLMNGEIGVNTGEMGTAMRYVTADESKLAREVLLPLTGALHRSGHTGYIDVSVLIDSEGNPCPMEFTSRNGWPLNQIQQVLHTESCEWMLGLLQGRDEFQPIDEIAVGVVVAIPDFPYSHLTNKAVSGFPVWGITDKNRYFIHPTEMKAGTAPDTVGKSISPEVPMMVSAGDNLLTCSGTGESVRDAKLAAYGVVDELEIPNSPMYRLDIGDRLKKQLPELQSMGYATAWEF